MLLCFLRDCKGRLALCRGSGCPRKTSYSLFVRRLRRAKVVEIVLADYLLVRLTTSLNLRTISRKEGRATMQPDFRVESRSYDQIVRGSWQAYRLDATVQLSDEGVAEAASDCLRLWLPAGTSMHWSTQVRPLRYNCLQFFWPQRWYMLSAFYNGSALVHTYANIIQPATIELDRLYYVDLDLSILVEPDLNYEVLTQVEFEQAAENLRYSEETRISALMALRTLISSVQLGVGLFATIPQRLRQADFHLAECHK